MSRIAVGVRHRLGRALEVHLPPRLRLGYEAGHRYLAALQEGKIDSKERYGAVPSISFVSDQISVDFSLGRTFEKAFVEPGEMILKKDGVDAFGREREAHIRGVIEAAERELSQALAAG